MMNFPARHGHETASAFRIEVLSAILMANLDTFCCARCGREFVAKTDSQRPVCPTCADELKRPARAQAPAAGQQAADEPVQVA